MSYTPTSSDQPLNLQREAETDHILAWTCHYDAKSDGTVYWRQKNDNIYALILVPCKLRFHHVVLLASGSRIYTEKIWLNLRAQRNCVRRSGPNKSEPRARIYFVERTPELKRLRPFFCPGQWSGCWHWVIHDAKAVASWRYRSQNKK